MGVDMAAENQGRMGNKRQEFLSKRQQDKETVCRAFFQVANQLPTHQLGMLSLFLALVLIYFSLSTVCLGAFYLSFILCILLLLPPHPAGWWLPGF